MKSILLLTLLAGCFHSNEFHLVHLQRKLERAKEKVAALTLEIDEAELALIRKRIEMKKGSSDLFIEEREALYRMIQAGSLQAQVELDRILQLITELSDKEKCVY